MARPCSRVWFFLFRAAAVWRCGELRPARRFGDSTFGSCVRSGVNTAQEADQEWNQGPPACQWTDFLSEVRLVRLPAEGRHLLRASILDTSERHRRERVQLATYQIAEAALTADDLPQLYRRIQAIVNELMPARNFYIALLDPKAQLISFPHYEDEVESTPAPRPLDTRLTSCGLRTGKALLVDGAMNARKRRVGAEVTFEVFPEVRYVESGAPAATWLGVPLSVGGKAFGVMAALDYHNDRAYGEEEQQILSFVAAQTALAIERKSAEQAVRESEQKFRALFEATSQGVMLQPHHAAPVGRVPRARSRERDPWSRNRRRPETGPHTLRRHDAGDGRLCRARCAAR